jgi:uncharacterized protein (DUF885 family)
VKKLDTLAFVGRHRGTRHGPDRMTRRPIDRERYDVSEPTEAALDLIDRYWEKLLELEPLLGTMVGDERYDDRLPDPSDAGRAARENLHRSAREELALLDRDLDDVDLRTTLDVLEAIASREIAALEHRVDRLQSVSHLWGPGGIIGELASMQRADSPERLDRYVARLGHAPEFYEAVIGVTKDGLAAGVTAPRVVVERALAQVERVLAAPVEESHGLLPVPQDDAAGRERVIETLRDHFMPALSRYLDALREYLPSATETIGLHALPGGDEIYSAQILSWTTLPLEARKVHDLGLEDLAKIQEERRLAAERIGAADPKAAVSLLDERGNRARTKEELVALAESQVAKGWEAARTSFGRMPSENCTVKPVEEFREADMPFAFYQPPSADGSRKGIYYVNGGDLEGKPLHHLATTTYHEANPGHHFQIAIEQELGERPALRRFGGLMAGSAFAEGWGLYSERLADEMGLFENEGERLGMLDMQGMRAARLVVDTGIHAFDWTREQAIDLLEQAGVAHTDAVIETDRYIALPGQALAYKTGQFEIEQQRADATKRDGDAFSLSAFHDRLLALGSLPLSALQRELSRTQK